MSGDVINMAASIDSDHESKSSQNSNSNTKTSPPIIESQAPSDYGYHLFPERKGDKYKPTWKEKIFKFKGTEEIDRIKCEQRIYDCTQKSPLIKLFLSALASCGCHIKLDRHFSCEVCNEGVNGGYDPEKNQVVVCQNVAKFDSAVHGALAHELVHMFDYCRAKLDFKNLEHLACSEIRAANLVHCSFMSAVGEGTASFINIAKRHRECVRHKAILSVLSVRPVSEVEARKVVDSVFDKCYNDLEPIGRRIRRNSFDMERAYQERYHYGYGD